MRSHQILELAGAASEAGGGVWGQCWWRVPSKRCWWPRELQSRSSSGPCHAGCRDIHWLSHLRSGTPNLVVPGRQHIRSGTGAHGHLRGPSLDELDVVPCAKSWLGHRHHLADPSCVKRKIRSAISKKIRSDLEIITKSSEQCATT